MRTSLRVALLLSAAVIVAPDPPAPDPGASPTDISAFLPAGAKPYQYHIPTATIVETVRADGRTGASTVADVTNTAEKLLTASTATNEQPIIDTDRFGHKWLVFYAATGVRTALEALASTDTFSANQMMVLIAGKPTSNVQAGSQCYVGVGRSTSAPSSSLSDVLQISDNSSAVPALVRSIRYGRQDILTSGNDPTYSTALQLNLGTILGQQFQVFGGVGRNATDVMSGSGNRFVRAGINNTGCNGSTSTISGTTGTGFVVGRRADNTSGATLMVKEIIIVSYNGTTQMTFAQFDGMRAAMQANHGIEDIEVHCLLMGDSRTQQSSTADVNAGAPGDNERLDQVNAHYRIETRATWPHGDAPSSIRLIALGAGGRDLSYVEQLMTAVPTATAGATLLTTYMLPGGGSYENWASIWMSHNDLGAQADAATYYGDTVGDAGTQGRGDRFLAKFTELIGIDATNLCDMGFTRIFPWNTPYSGTVNPASILPYVRGEAGPLGAGSTIGINTAGFVSACQNGDPSRIIVTFDPCSADLSLPVYNSTVTTFVGNTSYPDGFRTAISTSASVDPRYEKNGGNVVYPYFSIDGIHFDWGGSGELGALFGTFLEDQVAA